MDVSQIDLVVMKYRPKAMLLKVKNILSKIIHNLILSFLTTSLIQH